MIKPTRRAVVIFAIGVPLSLFAAIYDPALWPLGFAYGGAVLFAIVADAVLALPIRRLDIKVAVPEKLYIGEKGTIAVRLSAPASARLEILAEQSGVLDPPALVALRLAKGSERRVELPLVPHRRGQITVERLWLRWRGPLALAEMVRHIPLARLVDVVPNLRGVQSAALQFFAREAVLGVKVQRERGAGTEFEALRDYAPGLDSRVIDWKHSARHRRLVCKEFQAERNHQIVLAFDTGYLMREPMDGIPRLDHAINAGLILAWISLQGGDLVGLYGFDAAVRRYLQPVRGMASFGRIQQATAALDYRHEETNFTLGLAALNARLKRRALVILFTDFVDTITAELLLESMQWVASRHLVVFVTLRDPLLQRAVDAAPDAFADVARAVLAHDLLLQRRVVFERLERLGVHCLDVPGNGLSAGLVNRYLLIKQRGLI